MNSAVSSEGIRSGMDLAARRYDANIIHPTKKHRDFRVDEPLLQLYVPRSVRWETDFLQATHGLLEVCSVPLAISLVHLLRISSEP